MKRPLIGLPACVKPVDGSPFHVAGDKYLRAVAEAANGLPVILPALADILDPAETLDHLDGLLLTGSPSNVHPSRYGQNASEIAEPYDEARDRLTFPLIAAALERGLPVFAICRGLQELNVACGGSLYPRVHEIEGRDDHRRPKDASTDVQYGPRHGVTLEPGGLLSRLLEGPEATVNSLHWQAVERLGEGLQVEALAPDGTVEAFSMPKAKGFVLAVQWHPEYRATENPVSLRLFAAFAEACQRYQAARRTPQTA